MDGYISVLLVLFVLLGRSVGSELYSTVDLSPSPFSFLSFFSFHAHIICILNLNTSYLPTYLAVGIKHTYQSKKRNFFQSPLPFTFYSSSTKPSSLTYLVHTSRTTYNLQHATPHERLICILWGQVGTYVVFYCTTYVCVYAYFVLLLYLWSDKWR